MESFVREIMLIGEDNFSKLRNSKVLIFGVGGVGGYVCEALARSGVGHFMLVDHDTVSISNINRQIIALHSTIGKYKVDVLKDRILDINPDCDVEVKKMFYLPENQDEIDFKEYDYIIDCIDTITAKLNIIERAHALNIPLISSMGAGNRLDPTKIQVCDLFDTSYDALAKVMRRELKKRHIYKCKVVCSKELARKPLIEVKEEQRRSTPGSSAFVPSCFGLVIASEVMKDLIKE